MMSLAVLVVATWGKQKICLLLNIRLFLQEKELDKISFHFATLPLEHLAFLLFFFSFDVQTLKNNFFVHQFPLKSQSFDHLSAKLNMLHRLSGSFFLVFFFFCRTRSVRKKSASRS